MDSKNVDKIISKILKGDRYALSRGITIVESDLSSHQAVRSRLISACLRAPRNSKRIGISGAPGVGKSTFIDCFGSLLIDKGHRVAVLAIDPSSQSSKGSILGDKTRMKNLLKSENAYIRPSPNASYLGGIAKSSFESAILCEAAGFDIILVETVGVGQSEIQARHMVDVFLLLLQPATGDSLQALKKGIAEIADILIIHKADGALLDNAKTSATYYSSALKMMSGLKTQDIPVLLASSLNGTGMKSIWDQIVHRMEDLDIEVVRRRQRLYWFEEHIRDGLLQTVFSRFAANIEAKKIEIMDDQLTYYAAAEDFLNLISDMLNKK